MKKLIKPEDIRPGDLIHVARVNKEACVEYTGRVERVATQLREDELAVLLTGFGWTDIGGPVLSGSLWTCTIELLDRPLPTTPGSAVVKDGKLYNLRRHPATKSPYWVLADGGESPVFPGELAGAQVRFDAGEKA